MITACIEELNKFLLIFFSGCFLFKKTLTIITVDEKMIQNRLYIIHNCVDCPRQESEIIHKNTNEWALNAFCWDNGHFWDKLKIHNILN